MTRQRSALSTDLFGPDRPLRAAKLWVPTHLELGEKDDTLCWWADNRRDSFREVRPGPALLQDFVNLRDPAKILAYAKRWGVLEICEHGVPGGHRDSTNRYCGPWSYPGRRGAYFWEYLSDWRRQATLFGALLSLGARLRSGEQGAARDWDTVVKHRHWQGNAFFQRTGSAADYQKLALSMNVLIVESGVHPLLVWSKNSWCIEFVGSHVIACGLFGALVCQLMLAVTGTDGMEICSACGQAYVPGRRPHPARRNYCPRCRQHGVPQRDAARDYRQRNRSSDVSDPEVG